MAKITKKSPLRYQCEPQTVSKIAARTKAGDLLYFIRSFRSCAETRKTKIGDPIMGVRGGRASQANGSQAQPEPENCICEPSVQLWRLVCGGLPVSRICSHGCSGQPGWAGQAERSASRCRPARSSQAAFFLAGLTRSRPREARPETDSFVIHCCSLTSSGRNFSISIPESAGKGMLLLLSILPYLFDRIQ